MVSIIPQMRTAGRYRTSAPALLDHVRLPRCVDAKELRAEEKGQVTQDQAGQNHKALAVEATLSTRSHLPAP